MKPNCVVPILLLAAAALAPVARAAPPDRHAQASSDTEREPARRSATRPGAAPAAEARKLPRRQVGKASYYHPRFHGRTMADGTRMRPDSNNAASKTLPLGTKARVTNLETGQSAEVEIRDRGPYVKGRIVDLSPRTAREIGLEKEEGLAKVEVVPLELPDKPAPTTAHAGE